MTNSQSKYEVCEENYPIPRLTTRDADRYVKDHCVFGGSRRRGYTIEWDWDKMDYICMEATGEDYKELGNGAQWAVPTGQYIKQS